MRRRAHATHVRKQGLGGSGEFCAGDFVRGGFIAGTCNQLFDNDKLSLRTSGDSQMLQDLDAVFVRPIVENPADEENCDIFLPRWLRFKEVKALRNPNISARLWEGRG